MSSMTNLQQLINDFQKLSLDNKKGKLKNLIDAGHLEKMDPIFSQLKDWLDTNPDITDEFCIWVYEDIMWYAHKVAEHNKEKWLKQLESIKWKMNDLHKQEKQEKESENVEWLLDDLNWGIETIKTLKKSSSNTATIVTIVILLLLWAIVYWLYYFGYINL